MAEAEVRQKAIKDRDDLLAMEKVRLQTEICALQDRFARLLTWALDDPHGGEPAVAARLDAKRSR